MEGRVTSCNSCDDTQLIASKRGPLPCPDCEIHQGWYCANCKFMPSGKEPSGPCPKCDYSPTIWRMAA